METPGTDTTLVLADARLLEAGARATYAAHGRDGGWFFGGPEFLDDPAAQPTRVPRSRLLTADPSLAEVVDLAPGWHAFRTTPEDPWWSVEIPTGDLHLLSYEARATEAIPDRDGIGGAFISCWVMGDSLAACRERAQKHLEETGWAVVRELGARPIGAAEIPEDDRRYARQAEIDGEVYVINAFPPEEANA